MQKSFQLIKNTTSKIVNATKKSKVRVANRIPKQLVRYSSTFATKTLSWNFNKSALLAASSIVIGGISLYSFSNNFTFSDSNVPLEGVPGTKQERTFIAIKPDGVQRRLVGEIIARFEKKGYRLVAMKMMVPKTDFAKKHYEDLAQKPFFNGLVTYFSSGPVVAMVFEGHNVIKDGRKIIGATNPADSAAGTIRGDFAIQVGRNIIHGSDSAEGAKHEINLWFTRQDLCDWQTADGAWIHEK